MRTKDFHEIPKIRDQMSYLYVEHARVDQEEKAIALHDQYGLTPVPCASLALLMLGPGTRITHAAVLTLADNGCLVVWCGEEGVRFYAAGTGTTRNAAKLLHQASLCTHHASRLKVVRRMYEWRFEGGLDPDLSLQQIRGMEGVRVREAYARASKETGVPWQGRNYDRGQWKNADPVNRALSAANACLYGVCHAAIVAAGYSPALGFVHTGKQLSFVYDVADLYKAETTIPAAFLAAAAGEQNVEREVRLRCRDAFRQQKLLQRMVEDIDEILDIEAEEQEEDDYDADPAAPGKLWDPELGNIASGVQYADPPELEEKES
jgi:CRISPR-associated protein Cas1